ncbi:MAG: nucleotide sugar dehydrogenase [Gemmatimonadota bacterium]
MTLEQDLLSKIESHEARVGILGLGYVGLPLAVAFGEAGFPTLGFDVNPSVVRGIQAGKSHVTDVTPDRVQSLIDLQRLDATLDFSRLVEVDAIIICVPTPLSKTDDPDVSYILKATEAVRKQLRKGQLVILESTTYPGTTRELIQGRLEDTGLVAGQGFFVAFSPERVDPGNQVWHIENTPKIVGGLTPVCHNLAVRLYDEVIETIVEVSSPEVAELAKLLENTFRAVNIGLVNEMAVICDRLGIDVWEVIDAASTKPYGFMRFFPGPGLGGHCIPIDPLFLAWKMKTLQYRTRFIELAAEINAEMPRYVVERVVEALNTARKALNGSRVLLLGVSYKPDVDDTRESPALDILQLLEEKGAEVSYHDPYVPEIILDSKRYQSVDLTAGSISEYDVILVTTDHKQVDYNLVMENAKIVVDPRNALSGATGQACVYPIAGPPRNSQQSQPSKEHSAATSAG